jgi:hypothetical protein
MSDTEIEALAAKVRNHPVSAYDGENAPEDVIKSLLKQELVRLEDQEELSDRVSEKQTELKEDFGIK